MLSKKAGTSRGLYAVYIRARSGRKKDVVVLATSEKHDTRSFAVDSLRLPAAAWAGETPLG